MTTPTPTEPPKKEECKHRAIEFDPSTGMTVCQDCWTTLRANYNNDSTYL